MGLSLALAGALSFRYAMSTLMSGVPTTDLAAYALACGCLTIATVLACAIPASRAASLDPVAALRCD